MIWRSYVRFGTLTAALFGASVCAAQNAGPALLRCDENVPTLILRQDFSDVPILNICKETDENKRNQLKTAVGTRVSYSYDDIHNSSSASLDGLAALNFQFTPDPTSQYLSTVSAGPFVQGAGAHTFATPASPATNSGSVTAGAYLQFYLERPILPINYTLPFIVRLRGGEATDSAGVHDGVAVFELIPAFQILDLLGDNSALGRARFFVFGSPFSIFDRAESPTLVFSPEVEAQYDSYQSGPLKYGIFASHREAMRVGPLLALRLANLGYFFDPTSPLAQPLNRLAVSVSYHADWDSLSSQRFYSFQTALIINLDADAHYAVTTAYSIGDSEATGNRSRGVKVAFSAKF